MNEAKVNPLDAILKKFASYAEMSEGDRTEILQLPFKARIFETGSYLVREGDYPDHCGMLVSGLVCRHKSNGEGFRQIVAIYVPGDVINLQNLHLRYADHNVQMLTRCELTVIPCAALRRLATDRPSIAHVISTMAFAELSVAQEWMLNIGRRDARTRIAHLLCELAVRSDRRGLPPGQAYELPMTQEQLGDALGLTAVHVNRMLRGLVRDGLITYENKFVSIHNWRALVQSADFEVRYLQSAE